MRCKDLYRGCRDVPSSELLVSFYTYCHFFAYTRNIAKQLQGVSKEYFQHTKTLQTRLIVLVTLELKQKNVSKLFLNSVCKQVNSIAWKYLFPVVVLLKFITATFLVTLQRNSGYGRFVYHLLIISSLNLS